MLLLISKFVENVCALDAVRFFQDQQLEHEERYQELVQKVEKERERWRIQKAVSYENTGVSIKP